jgi:hypothetical protein
VRTNKRVIVLLRDADAAAVVEAAAADAVAAAAAAAGVQLGKQSSGRAAVPA